MTLSLLQFSKAPRSVLRLAVVMATAAALDFDVGAAQPKIDRIELLTFADLVTVHFDTEPNRKYELQFIDRFAGASSQPAGAWSNLFTAPAVPFPNHYVIADTHTNRYRFYRLRVTP